MLGRQGLAGWAGEEAAGSRSQGRADGNGGQGRLPQTLKPIVINNNGSYKSKRLLNICHLPQYAKSIHEQTHSLIPTTLRDVAACIVLNRAWT